MTSNSDPHQPTVSEIIDSQAYNICASTLIFPIKLPFPPEAHVATWRRYIETGKEIGLWITLKTRLAQLQFPVRSNISNDSDAYRAATRKGAPTAGMLEATGLVLQQPELLHLNIHPSIAGDIPVLTTPSRADFVSLVQAFTKKNEPVPIPDSMGACTVVGYNNWDRIRAYREQWEAKNPANCSESAWQAEFKQLIPQTRLYQDRFMILSSGSYSSVSADELGLGEDEWRRLSMAIRLGHECVHYSTKRFFGVMRNHVFDELVADYAGIVAAIGYYRADWFLHFMGLESFPKYREGGRLQNYVGDMPRSGEAFRAIQALVKMAAENLQEFDIKLRPSLRGMEDHILVLLAITCLTLAKLASNDACHQIMQTLNELQEQQREK